MEIGKQKDIGHKLWIRAIEYHQFMGMRSYVFAHLRASALLICFCLDQWYRSYASGLEISPSIAPNRHAHSQTNGSVTLSWFLLRVYWMLSSGGAPQKCYLPKPLIKNPSGWEWDMNVVMVPWKFDLVLFFVFIFSCFLFDEYAWTYALYATNFHALTNTRL